MQGGTPGYKSPLFHGIGPYPNFDFPSNRLARAFVIPMNNHEASLIVARPRRLNSGSELIRGQISFELEPRAPHSE